MNLKHLIAGCAVTLISIPAIAGMGGTGEMMGHCTHYKTMGHESGIHQMMGTVTGIDHHTGMISVKTGEGVLRLHFPPKSLKNVKHGERLDIRLGFTPVR